MQLYKLKLVDGNYAFNHKLPNGWKAPDNVATINSGRWDRTTGLYRTLNHDDTVTFTRPQAGPLTHYQRETASLLLPAKVLAENKDAFLEETGADEMYDLGYRGIYAEMEPDLDVVDLYDYEELPGIDAVEAPDFTELPEGTEWVTFAEYAPFGPEWHGLLPGTLTGASKALAMALDASLPRNYTVWTHKADQGNISGHRPLGYAIRGGVFAQERVNVDAKFSMRTTPTLRGNSLADALAEFDQLVDDFNTALTTTVELEVL